MIIDQKFLDSLSAHAKANPRLRQSYDLRTTPDDKSQRMLNALEPGTIMPIHRHRNTSETMVMVRGKLIERFYDDDGNITDEFLMDHCGQYPMVQIEVGRWHSALNCSCSANIFWYSWVFSTAWVMVSTPRK